MQPWFVFALLSVFAIAAAEIAQKVSLTHKADVSAITNNFFVWTFQGIGGLALAYTFKQTTFHLLPNDWLRLAAVAVIYFFGGTFFYTSYKTNSPSISIILGSISVVVSTTLGIIFFNESTQLGKFAGLAMILFAIVAVNYNRQDRFTKHNLYAFLGGLCYGTGYTLDKSFAIHMPPMAYVGLMCLSVAFVSLILKAGSIIKESRKLSPPNFIRMAVAGLFGILFNFFTFTAYSKNGNVGVVDAMNNSSVFLVILMEMVLLKDRTNFVKKLSCAALVGAGMVILSRV